MPKLDSNWKKSQRHEKDVYSERETHASATEAEKIFKYFDRSLEDIKGSRILSVGSGMGIIHSFDFECEAIALDPLSTHNSSKLKESSASLTTGVGEYLPFKDNSIDYIYTYNVLDHCIDPRKVLREISRVNKYDGELLLEVNTYEVPKMIRQSVIGNLDTEHPHHFSSGEVRSLVTSSGYEIRSETILNRFELLKNPTLRRIGAMPFRMRRYFITAKKRR